MATAVRVIMTHNLEEQDARVILALFSPGVTVVCVFIVVAVMD